jgi:hypothetical protein
MCFKMIRMVKKNISNEKLKIAVIKYNLIWKFNFINFLINLKNLSYLLNHQKQWNKITF